MDANREKHPSSSNRLGLPRFIKNQQADKYFESIQNRDAIFYWYSKSAQSSLRKLKKKGFKDAICN